MDVKIRIDVPYANVTRVTTDGPWFIIRPEPNVELRLDAGTISYLYEMVRAAEGAPDMLLRELRQLKSKVESLDFTCRERAEALANANKRIQELTGDVGDGWGGMGRGGLGRG